MKKLQVRSKQLLDSSESYTDPVTPALKVPPPPSIIVQFGDQAMVDGVKTSWGSACVCSHGGIEKRVLW